MTKRKHLPVVKNDPVERFPDRFSVDAPGLTEKLEAIIHPPIRNEDVEEQK